MTMLKCLETFCFSATLFQLSSLAKIVPRRNLNVPMGIAYFRLIKKS